MLTFFRRIRKSFLDTGKAQKYILYAVGEIALVVIGILIALQINTWNGQRLDQELKMDLLVALSEDLRHDQTHLDETLAYDSMRWEMATFLIDTLSDRQMNIDLDLVNKHLSRVNKSYSRGLVLADRNHVVQMAALALRFDLSFDSRKSTFQSLSQGNLLIKMKDIDLQNAITNYYNAVDIVNRAEGFIREKLTFQYTNFVINDMKITSDFDYLMSKRKEVLKRVEIIKESIFIQFINYNRLADALKSLQERVNNEIHSI